ncbi:MAG TPA: cytochrome c [Flavisolibacter sp.]|jgi:mono/diheme cytochrome c family protein|nr:cytochrome c [Flavisolibacter sp.]
MRLQTALLILALPVSLWAKAAPPVEEGALIFNSRCAGCHNVNKTVTGPALAGVDQRHTIDWIVSFVHSSQTLVQKGDKDAVALFEKFNRIPMPDHPDLTPENIASIVAYIKSETKAEEKAPFRKPGKLHPNYLPVSITNTGFFAVYLAVVMVLAGVLLLLVNVKAAQRDQ